MPSYWPEKPRPPTSGRRRGRKNWPGPLTLYYYGQYGWAKVGERIRVHSLYNSKSVSGVKEATVILDRGLVMFRHLFDTPSPVFTLQRDNK